MRRVSRGVHLRRRAVSLRALEISTRPCDASRLDKPAFVLGDRGRVVQIVANLLSNAIKYSPKHEPIKIVVTRPPEGDRFFRVDVEDHGPGIPEKDVGHLFTRFFRVSRSTAHSATGTGLGLAITRALVELRGGEIWVKTGPGKGSTFSFTLPAAPPTIPDVPATERSL